MRTLFIFLLLANLLFLVWAQGYFGSPEENREPQRLARQLAPEKLKIVSATLPGSRPAVEICRLVEGLGADDAQRLRQAIGEKLPALRIASDKLEDPSSFWVLIPPLPDRASAEKKLTELKRLGVSGYQLVEDEGPLQLAILLGAFTSQQAGSDFLQALVRRGVRSAKLQVSEKTVLKLQGSSDGLEQRLREALQAFPPAVLKPCAEQP